MIVLLNGDAISGLERQVKAELDNPPSLALK